MPGPTWPDGGPVAVAADVLISGDDESDGLQAAPGIRVTSGGTTGGGAVRARSVWAVGRGLCAGWTTLAAHFRRGVPGSDMGGRGGFGRGGPIVLRGFPSETAQLVDVPSMATIPP